MRGLATIIGGKEEDLRTQMMTAGMALAGEFAGAEPGDPTGIMFLRQVRKLFYCIRQRLIQASFKFIKLNYTFILK